MVHWKASRRVLVIAAATALTGVLALVAPEPGFAARPNGYPITNVNLRAGPGTDYPVIVTVPSRAPITILGCLPDYAWCDSLFDGNRGWMRSIYLSGFYQGNYYSLREYAPRLGYRVVSFDIDGYWDSNYRQRPFYGERARWNRPREEGFVNTGIFYNRLAPYGNWVWLQGQYVWVPSGVDRSWRPYTRGRWVYTDRGWTWASNEPFGWATYHYGRWGFSNRVGWFWVPGNRWAPAWVSWRESDDYLAWAPMPPGHDGGRDGGAGFSVDVSVGNVPDYYWQVVPSADFLADDIPQRVLRDKNRQRPILERSRPLGSTTVNNNVVVNSGVNVTYVEQKTKTKVVERRIARTKNAKQAGRIEGDSVEIFQPAADETPATLAPPKPKKIEEVAKESETKEQSAGEAATDELLVPPEVTKAEESKAAKPKDGQAKDGEPAAPAAGEPPLPQALPKGGEAAGPPPDSAAPSGEPVPAEDLTPAGAGAAPPAPAGEPTPAERAAPPPPPPPPPPPVEEPAPAPPPPPVEEPAPPPPPPPVEEPAPPPPPPPPPLEEPAPLPPPPPPPPEESAPPPPPPAERAAPPQAPQEGEAPKSKKEGKRKKDKGGEAQPDEPPAMEPAPPPPSIEDMAPPPPPQEDAAPKAKKEGKPKKDKREGREPSGPPPPPAADGDAPPNGKKKGAPQPEPCPEGTMLLDDGSCAPTPQ